MKRLTALLPAMVLAGCGGVQSADGRDGVESALIGGLFDGFLGVTLLVYLFVVVLLVIAVVRGRRHRREQAGLQGDVAVAAERRWWVGLIAFASVTALILAGLSIATWLTDRALDKAGKASPLEVQVISHQWWWEMRYQDPDASRGMRTANELHIPADRTTHLRMTSPDVIHSLWIPNLAGKQDMIPGRVTDLMLTPKRPGRYRAQCAEYCGLQHAHMAFDVIVDPPAQFTAWYEAGLKPPPTPSGGPAMAGMMLFQARQCASCHTIAGTKAAGQVAPDLSHFASRPTIAAGTLPMTRANIRAWVADPQKVKPGNRMPKVPLSGPELDAITSYMESLK